METISDYVLLCERLECLPRPLIVAVEGFASSGKTRLANDLAKQFEGSAFHTDAYLIGEDQSKPYSDRVDQSALGAAVAGALSPHSLILIEGVCLRNTLRHSAIDPGIFVYVKRIAPKAGWNDGFNLEDFERGVCHFTGHELSDFAYHARARPHELAHIIYERFEA